MTLLAAAKLGLKVFDVDTALSAVNDVRQVRPRAPGRISLAAYPDAPIPPTASLRQVLSL